MKKRKPFTKAEVIAINEAFLDHMIQDTANRFFRVRVFDGVFANYTRPINLTWH